MTRLLGSLVELPSFFRMKKTVWAKESNCFFVVGVFQLTEMMSRSSAQLFVVSTMLWRPSKVVARMANACGC